MSLIQQLEQAERLTKLYLENGKALRDLFRRQVDLGKMILQIQEELGGEKNLRKWLKNFCPKVHWLDVQGLIAIATSYLAEETER